MCTAATYKTEHFYMGRTLDYEFSYGEEITVTPRGFRFDFRHDGTLAEHYAMIGMAHVADGYPLYYDAVNEKGLGMAGLNFVGNADYSQPREGSRNVAQFEFIPWVLSQCADISQARELISAMTLTGTPFSEKLPAAQLHWIIADKSGCIVVESTENGLQVFENKAGVLTNNPPFEQQMFMLNNYMSLSPKDPVNSFADSLELTRYSRGMGAIGLPGDLSSASRFARVAFTRNNSCSGNSVAESVGQFFHILGSVEQARGCCEVAPGKFEITIYTSCWDAQTGVYYYTTYLDRRINAVDIHRAGLNGCSLVRYPMLQQEDFNYQN